MNIKKAVITMHNTCI